MAMRNPREGHRPSRGRISPETLLWGALLLVLASALVAAGAPPSEPSFLPTGPAARILTVTPGTGPAAAGVTVVTEALAERESGPAETIRRFGEVYVFAPAFFAVRRDEPTAITFWNLQGDDVHDVLLVDPSLRVLMKVLLPPLTERSFVFRFHREGLYTFYCTFHQPAMSGQILVLPPAAGGSAPEP